jgi:histidine triad (HIT) family protein
MPADVSAADSSRAGESRVDCVFCRAIAGDEPATWVEREERVVAFAPLAASALAPGHTLVVPIQHNADLFSADPESLSAAIALTQRVARAMRAALGATGVVVLQASGTDAGQSVPHLHFHVVPTWPDDGTTHWPERVSAHRVAGDPYSELAEMFE